MISCTLLTITMFFSSGPETPITPDEIGQSTSNFIQVFGRIEDRIGNKILIPGFEERVSVATGIKIQKRGRNDRSAIFLLNLLREKSGWLVVHAQTSTPWKTISNQQSLRLDQSLLEKRKMISRFLLRESSPENRFEMWSSLKRHWNHQWVDWIQLGGQYLSATKELTNTIEKQNLQSIATQAGLYFHQGDWVSKFDFQTIHHLEEIDGQVSKTIQNKLKKLLLIDIERLLTLAKKTNTSSQVKPGTSRKVVRALLGNPGNVTWVEWQNHMLEQWDYSEQSVRIVDGRVCEVVSENNNATR